MTGTAEDIRVVLIPAGGVVFSGYDVAGLEMLGSATPYTNAPGPDDLSEQGIRLVTELSFRFPLRTFLLALPPTPLRLLHPPFLDFVPNPRADGTFCVLRFAAPS